MAVGAMIDLGIDIGRLNEELKKLHFDDFSIDVQKTTKSGLVGTKFNVIEATPQHHHRTISDIFQIIDQSQINPEAKILSKRIFTALGEAEAFVHNKNINEIHFHEVGAVDSIVDIVAFAICFEMIAPEEVVSSPVNVGGGVIRCAHGLLPVPGPAVAELLKNVPIYSAHAESELTTPTGAAIIKTIASSFKRLPQIKVNAVGYGFGSKNFDFPNALRIFQGTIDQTNEVALIETNIDDMNPEIYSALFEELFKLGALDVFLNQVIMKKNRPGVVLSVLCRNEKSETIRAYILKNTSSFGLRYTTLQRDELERQEIELVTKYGKIKAKAGYLNGELIKISPEFDSCQALSQQIGVEFVKIYHEAMATAQGVRRVS